ncbi:4Fe-4S binding protein [Adlercreutzia muris]|uniref:4Fe-4S binding protein n=1 Tax=Adlercreutzia muris TaxID=1796610 RepID=UPI001F58CB09|nr:4Fe-4S binding protein [Adlercreutzia muris]
MNKEELRALEDEIMPNGMRRRDFLKGAAAFGMGVMPLAMLLSGCSTAPAAPAEEKLSDTAESPEGAAEGSPAPSDISTTDGAWVDPSKSDSLLDQVMAETEEVTDAVRPDGTVIPAIYVRMRNRINRIGNGIGSIPDETGYEMIMYLWSEEDAENYLKMPMHRMFTTGDYMAATGFDEETCQQILDDQADRCLIWRTNRGGLPHYALIPYINGFWEFNELLAHFSGVEGAVAEFDTQGITGVDPNGENGTTFPLFRTYPISVDVVAEDQLQPFQDWRALIRRNKNITVSPCQCRTMWEALGVPHPDEHPHRTCLSLGDMAEYFMETGIGEQITQDEAIAIVEDIIDKGMVVESICAKNADIICCCHSESCGNLMAWRGKNGQGDQGKFFSAYMLQYDGDACIKCGKCLERCPMHSITFGDDGLCVMDAACVRCGQCIPDCPSQARILTATEGYPDLPEDYMDCNRYFAKDRMARGQLVDFTGGNLEAKAAPEA